MAQKKVLITRPNDFRIEARIRFATAQMTDIEAFVKAVSTLGHVPIIIPDDLSEPTATYTAIKAAIEQHKPDCVVKRSYLWADPPIGQAITLATPPGIPIASAAYIAPLGEKLG